MNIYRYKFTAECPSDGGIIEYKLEIRAPFMVWAEDIVSSCVFEKAYHEDIANVLYEKLGKLGGEHRLVANHRGVEVETVRP